jgi:starch synthase (maltosyl-transferring)
MSLKHAPGRARVIIESLTPCVDGGKYPVKRVLGDATEFRVHAFADSHDLLKVEFCHRRKGATDWVRAPMQEEPGNDEWTYTFQPWEIGLYEYTVIAGIDHFGSWRDGFGKKLGNGEPVQVEFLIGGELVAAAAARAEGDNQQRLQEFANILQDAERSDRERIDVVYSEELYWLVSLYPDPDLQTAAPTCLLMTERHLAAFSTWYEYFPRSCGPDVHTHGTFQDAKSRLFEIDRMGFNIVYFPPIHPIGKAFRKGKNNSLTPSDTDVGSPWAVGADTGGHKDILPELGTLEDFKSFIDEAARYEIEVALDIAFQCSPDHPWVKEHPQWFKWRPDGTVQYAENPPKKYQDILPINFENEDWENLWQELKAVFDYWIDVGVKVFRVDNPHTKSLAFWNWCILEVKKDHPEVLFLAEAFTRPKRKYNLAKAGFTHGYTYFTWRNTPSEMREYLTELTTSETKDYFWPNFWPNTPDILHEDLQVKNRAVYMGRYVLAATLSSNIGIYGPAYELMDHEPFPGKEENNNSEKYELKQWDWNAKGNLKNEIARVNEIRNSHPALQTTFNVVFADSDNPHFLCYLKQNWDRSDQILVVVNMDWEHTQSGFIDLPLEHMGIGEHDSFTVRDLYDPFQAEYTWQGGRNYIELNPHFRPAHIFKIKRL